MSQKALKKCKACKNKIKEVDLRVINISTIHKDCFNLFVKQHIEKTQKNKKKRSESLLKTKNEGIKTKNLTSTQTVVNRYIRLRDAKGGSAKCISCRRAVRYGDSNCNAGHYKTVGARSDLRFNEDNIHAQCAQCNVFNNSHSSISVGERYTRKLIKKIGQERVDALNIRTKQDYSIEGLKKIRISLKNNLLFKSVASTNNTS